MKRILIFAAAVSLLTACGEIDSSTPETPPEDEITYIETPIDLVQEIYNGLVNRVGEQELPTQALPTGTEGGIPPTFTEDTMGQIVNCEYVCGYINQKWGTSIVPVAGTEKQAANMEYVLRMVDLANSKLGTPTNYGTGSYATKQAADTVAANACVNRLIPAGSTWVAVATDGMICTSKDGINWVPHSLDSPWIGVASGNGKWVAVGHGGKIATSTDGENWTTTALTGSWTGIAFGNGTYVAVGPDKIATCTDGVNWTTTALTGSWTGIAYGNGRFVAVGIGNDSGIIATSINGTSWTGRKTLGAYMGVAYGNGKWIAAGLGSFATGTNGTTWAETDYPGNWVGIACGKYYTADGQQYRWYAVSFDGKYTTSNDDGETWSKVPGNFGPTGTMWCSIAYGKGSFVAVANNGLIATNSGNSWSINTTVGSYDFQCVAFEDIRWVATCTDKAILVSTDTKTWTRRNIFTALWSGIKYRPTFSRDYRTDRGTWIAAYIDGTIATSDNGTSWTKVFEGNYYWNGIFEGLPSKNFGWVVLGRSGYIYSQKNGLERNQQYHWYDRAYFYESDDNYRMVMVGNSGQIATIIPGATTWTYQTVGDSRIEWHGVAYGNGRWVAVGQIWIPGSIVNGYITTSTDGTTWSTPISFMYIWDKVVYGNNRWIVLGSDEGIIRKELTSTNGVAWSELDIPGGIWGIAYANNIWVAVGNNTVCTSTNGTTWTSQTVVGIYGKVGGINT
jgi:hypothetical protein